MGLVGVVAVDMVAVNEVNDNVDRLSLSEALAGMFCCVKISDKFCDCVLKMRKL